MSKRFERITLNITIPIILRGRKKAPERCVRNLMELGETMNPHITIDKKKEIYNQLLKLCNEATQQDIINYFSEIYVL